MYSRKYIRTYFKDLLLWISERDPSEDTQRQEGKEHKEQKSINSKSKI